MASITSLMSSSSSNGIYGNKSVISGLASGMDTESMIENAVSGIKQRIAGLNQSREMLEWEQNAFRSIIDKLSAFSDKYLSFASSTNLLSAAFFNNSTTVSTSGKYADLISATGNPSSTVKVLGVTQLAEAAVYNTGLKGAATGFATSELKLSDPIKTSAVAGSMTLRYNEIDVTLDLGDTVYESMGDLATAINEKLKGTDLENYVTAKVGDDGSLSFTAAEGKALKVTSVSDGLKNTLGIESGDEDIAGKTFGSSATKLYNEDKTVLDNMIGKEFSFTLDGVTKTIKLDEDDKTKIGSVADLRDVLDAKITSAFGAGKVSVAVDGDKLSFNTVQNGSTLKITGAEELGLSSLATSYVDMGKKLSDLGITPDANGEYKFTLNGKTLTFNSDTTLASVISAINNDADMGVKVSFSQMTNSFQFTTKETGANSKIEFGDDLAAQLFDKPANPVMGKDAILTMEVNGVPMTDMTRSSNDIEVDGMTIKLKGTFPQVAGEEAVSFTAAADTDKIVSTLKSMVEEFNAMANEIKDAYSTQPLRDSKGKRYKPLTAEDAEDMSESAIEKYEKKAKTGILFGDSDLSALYNELRNALGDLDLGAIGITTEFDGGKTTLKLDETKLRNVLENDPDKVRDTLTKTKADGAASDGMLTQFKASIEKYAKTTGTKGILVKRAGSEKSAISLVDNEYKNKMDQIEKQIDRWEKKLSTKIDYYTRQFSALEQLISKMNSQSSALYGMMGY